MPPMPGSPAGIGFSSSGMSVTSAAVVRIITAAGPEPYSPLFFRISPGRKGKGIIVFYYNDVINWIRKPKPPSMTTPRNPIAHLRPAISAFVARCGTVASNLASIRAKLSSTLSEVNCVIVRACPFCLTTQLAYGSKHPKKLPHSIWAFRVSFARYSYHSIIAADGELSNGLQFLTPKQGRRRHSIPDALSLLFTSQTDRAYIMPPIPPMPGSPAGIGFSSSGMSVISAAVVRIIAAIELAFSTALRVTLTGSDRPAPIMST